MSEEISQAVKAIPVITTHSPLNWDYTVIGIVTAQSVTGTGVFSEISSSFTDFFGAQSGAYNEKIRHGEDLCLAQLRRQTLSYGGSAIIATDIDYCELGGNKGMIMVCMSGTCVKLHNPEVLQSKLAENIHLLTQMSAEYEYYKNLTKQPQ